MVMNRRGLVLLNLIILLVSFAYASTNKGNPRTGWNRSRAASKESKGEVKEPSKTGNTFQWLSSRFEQETEGKDESSNQAEKGSKSPDKQKDGSGWWLRPQKKKEAKSPTADKPSKQEEEKKKQARDFPEKEKGEPTPKNASSSANPEATRQKPPSTNTTTTYMIMRPQQQVPSIYMTPSGGTPPPGMGSPQMVPGGRAPPTTNVVLVSYAASLVSALIRLWFLTSITKWFGEEAVVRPTQHFMWERLNDYFCKDESALQTAMSLAPPGMSNRKWRHIQHKQGRRKPPKPSYEIEETYAKTVLVVDVTGSKEKGGSLDLPHLQQVVTFVLTQHRQHAFGTTDGSTPRELEVVLLVESPGGAVQDFGLAATQIGRLSNEPGITTTVCVDNVAASGGYMIASQANRLCAAPFAMLGSVGVFRQGFNIHDFLERQGIQPLMLKAGECKVPLTIFGEVTKTDLKSAQRQLDKTHRAFQEHVVQGRPSLAESFEDVCNGDVFLGSEAKDLALVDLVVTSEEYLLERIMAGDRVLKLHHSHQIRFGKRKLSPMDFILHRTGGLRAFLKEYVFSGSASAMVSRMVHTTSILGFAQYLLRNRLL